MIQFEDKRLTAISLNADAARVDDEDQNPAIACEFHEVSRLRPFAKHQPGDTVTEAFSVHLPARGLGQFNSRFQEFRSRLSKLLSKNTRALDVLLTKDCTYAFRLTH